MDTNDLFTQPQGTSSRGTGRCHLTEEGVALYVDAILLQRIEELPSSLREHVEMCLECETQIMGVYELSKKVYPIAAKRPHPYFDRNKVREPEVRYTAFSYRIAAAIGTAALLAAGYYALVNGSHKQPAIVEQQNPKSRVEQSQHTQQTIAQKPNSVTTPKKESQALLADNFTESSNLEDLVHGEFRSTTIEVLAPTVGQKVQQPILFKWKTFEENVMIKILNNKERILFSHVVDGNSYTYKKKLPPGLYYWKLETDKDLLHIGKFLVK